MLLITPFLVYYYLARCIHCQRLEPTLEAAAKILHSSHTDSSERKVKVGKIDGATERALASRFNIRGFPSIFLIDGWEVREYEGPRTVSFFSSSCLKFSNQCYYTV
jgi:thioredoxin-like negative regulator of GroEL